MCGASFKRGLSLLLLLLFCQLLLVAQQPDALTELSSSISDKLLNLKQQIETFKTDLTSTTASLAQASTDLKTSEQERLRWEATSTSLYSSLTSINEELNSSYETITVLKTQLKTATKWIIIGLCVIGLRIIAMIAGFILYAKGIKLPRWVDILL